MVKTSGNNGYTIGSDIAIDVRKVKICTSNKTVEKARARLFFIGVCFFLIFGVLAARLFELSVYRKPLIMADVQHNPMEMKMKRADIVDRNGIILATSLPVVNFYAHPHLLKDAKATARAVANIFPDMSAKDLEKKLNPERKFVYIKRNITPKEQFEVNKLGIPGLSFEQTEHRVYPQGNLFSHVLGYVDVDNKGMAGIELSFNEELSEKQKMVQLSLDMRVQEVVRTQLTEAVEVFKATGGIGAVMDVENGEIIAMVSLPDFDPNDYKASPKENFFNKATFGVYEVGSVFKLFNTAMAIESGKVKVSDKFDATKPLIMARHKISDFSPKNRWLDVEEILVYSSNIGSAKMALEVGSEFQQQFLRKIGFFDSLDLEIPENASPLSPTTWRDVNVATISYGYGFAVSTIHVLNAMSAMVNGGRLYEATLQLSNDNLKYRQVISEKTSDTLRRLVRKVVTDGSGGFADVGGYLVGGKTGSAQMRENGKYISGKLRTTFMGAFPIDNPKYSLVITLNEPKRIEGTYGNTSGWNATPTAGKIIERIAPALGIEPDEQYKNKITKNVIEAHFIND